MEGKAVYVDYQRLFSKTARRTQPMALRQTAKYMIQDGYIKMAGGFPSPELFPVVEASFKLRDSTVLNVDKDLLRQHMQYGLSQGYPDLRNWLIEFHRQIHNPPTIENHLHPGHFDLMITSGSLQALHSVFNALLDEGDWVFIEEATFPASLGMAHQLGAQIQDLRVDAEGIVAEDLRKILTSWGDLHPGVRKPKLLYTIPSGGNPTGITMSLARKREIYQLARQHDIIIMEDDAYYFLSFAKPLVPSFLSMDVDGRVVRVESFSKVIAPGLRAGVVSGPAPLLQKLRDMHDQSALSASGLTQVMLLCLFRHWGVDGFLRHADCLAEHYKSKMEMTIDSATRHLTGLAEWNRPGGGMFLWLRVPGVSDTEILIHALLKDGVLMVHGSPFAVIPASNSYSHVRVSFGLVTPEDCDKAFESLAKAIRSVLDTAGQ